MKIVVSAAVFSLLSLPLAGEVRDTLQAAVAGADIKLSGRLSSQPLAYSEIHLRRLERDNIRSAGDLSAAAPNFFQPQYGSHITSSIYFRGFGSRIDQPVVGIYMDDIPILNKNAYDFDFPDLRRITVLRGPQGVLFGRNSSLGVIRLETLSPFDWTGVRAKAEGASNGSWRASASVFQHPRKDWGWSASAAFSHEGGFFSNEYDGRRCDSGDALSLRGRVQWRPAGGWQFDNSLQAGWLQEGGYAYGLWDPDDGRVLPVNYNDPSGYRRLHVMDGLSARKSGGRTDFSASLSWQYLDDRMELDNDFTPLSYFRLVQAQQEHGLTAEVMLRGRPEGGCWHWLAGGFLFGKWLRMQAPVTFLEDGVKELILANANAGIATAFPGEEILIREREFVIDSDFRIPAYGAALFGEAAWTCGRWTLSAGLRLDTERTTMDYASAAAIDWQFTLVMPDYERFETEFRGREQQFFFVPLPKLSATYALDRGLLYATAQRGHKAGGFNTQLFSDILQNRMMDGMMRELGVSMGGGRYDSAAATRYHPESTWNFECGAHLMPVSGLRIDAALFWIECTDQQITVMAPGMSTGRMMSNAARSRSRGGELSAAWTKDPWTFGLDYGGTYATTSEGRRLPYAPEQTLSMSGFYRRTLPVGAWLDEIGAGARLRGVGRIWWDEQNSLCQPFYALLSASLTLRRGACAVTLWGENLTGTRYRTFWFRSLQRDFFALGRPFQWGIRISCDI